MINAYIELKFIETTNLHSKGFWGFLFFTRFSSSTQIYSIETKHPFEKFNIFLKS